MVARSTDDGSTWGQPQHISPPLVGQPFEVCHTIVELADGRWLAPVSCLRCWDGAAPNGLKHLTDKGYRNGFRRSGVDLVHVR